MSFSQKSKDFLTKLQNLDDKHKKIILWTIVAILGVVMGYFWVNDAINSLSKMGESVKSINLPAMNLPSTDILSPSGGSPEGRQTTTPSTANPVAQTADWKTYTNSDYGFEIKYPADWNKVDDSGLGNIFFGCPQIKMGGTLSCPLSLNIASLSEDSSSNFLQIVSSKQEKNINGLKTIVYSGSDDLGETLTVAFIYGQKNIVFIEDVGQTYQANGIFDNIISTFKFTN